MVDQLVRQFPVIIDKINKGKIIASDTSEG